MTDLERHADRERTDASEATLAVTGAVDRPGSFTIEDLASLGLERFTADFACVEGWVESDRSWRGVRVGTLLDRVGPTANSEYALVRATDGDYACSFPLDRVREAILALELDGEPLSSERGGPMRLVPTSGERDCWESVKRVTEIEVTESPRTNADTAKDLALSRIE